jgi:hypothetical protein
MLVSLLKRKNVKNVTKENFLKCKIIRGNRQVKEVNVKASKRFRVGIDTYIIKSDCIRTKISGSRLESVIYYSEGNPNPHNFREKNIGLKPDDFNKIYGSDLYDMLVKIQSDKKAFYLIMLYIFVLAFSVISLITGFF